MKTLHKIAGVALVLLLAGAAYGIFKTQPVAPSVPTGAPPTTTTVPVSASHGASAPAQPQIVDQTPLKIAQELAPLATLPGERQFAEEAIRLTDHEVDIAFTAALRDAALHPPALSPEAKEIQSRMQKAEHALTADQAQIAQLNASIAKATGDQKDSLEDQLDIADAARTRPGRS